MQKKQIDKNKDDSLCESQGKLELTLQKSLLSSLIDELKVKEDTDTLANVKNFRFSIFDMITELTYARVIFPCSKSKSVSDVFPKLYNYSPMSEDQVYDEKQIQGEWLDHPGSRQGTQLCQEHICRSERMRRRIHILQIHTRKRPERSGANHH